MKESPVITLPEDEKWVDLLKEKLEYYRIRSKEQHRSHPELVATTDLGYKIRVLSTLLEQGEIPTWDLRGTVKTVAPVVKDGITTLSHWGLST